MQFAAISSVISIYKVNKINAIRCDFIRLFSDKELKTIIFVHS